MDTITYHEIQQDHNCKEQITRLYNPANRSLPGNSVAEVNVGCSYNGSGPSAFGGASSWTRIRAEISFHSEASVDQVQSLLDDLTKVLNKHGYTN